MSAENTQDSRATEDWAAEAGPGPSVEFMDINTDDQLLMKKWWSLFSEVFQKTEGFEPHPGDKAHLQLFSYFVRGAYAYKCSQAYSLARRTTSIGNQATDGHRHSDVPIS